jgi:integrase
MTAGNITRRGKNSWRLKFDLDRAETGKRSTLYVTVRGTKAQAKAKLAELLAAAGGGLHVTPSKITVAEHVGTRIAHWQAAGSISPKTAERYRELAENQIIPHLGCRPVQKLRSVDVEAWHRTLRTQGRKDGGGGVSARTIGHAHRVLVHALADAMRHDLVSRNVASVEGAPEVDEEEVQVVPKARVGELLDKLRGRPIYARAVTALFTGIRRGEMLALRWSSVDLEGRVIRVRETLEQTKAYGVRAKPPKTKAGRRDISLPEIVVDALREHRRQQLELRLALGIGKMPEDALLFPAPFALGHQSPRAFSKKWARVAASIGMAEVTFHALRHTHASQLIEAGVDMVTISKRLGHAKPDITLRVYAHLFTQGDAKAAQAIDTALTGLGTA